MKKLTPYLLAILFVVSATSLFPGKALAAISFVGSAESSSAPNADTTVDISVISLLEGDLVIVAGAIGDDDSVNHDVLNNTTGYIEITDLFADDDDDTNLAVWYKFMGATPDTSVVVEGTTGGTDSSLAVVVMVFRGVDTGTPFDVTSTTATGINDFSPNPPSIDHLNPSGVWTVIAGASGHLLTGNGTYTFPTGYTTNAIDRGQDDTNDVTVGMGYRSSGVSDPEDPNVMTHSGTTAITNSWAAVTMVLRPAVAPTVTTQVTPTATSITQTTATLNGNITATGGANATVRGFAYGTVSTLATVIATTTDTVGAPFGISAHTAAISSLTCNTTYYSRAYATNSAGDGLGSIESFVTSSCVSAPTVTTNFAGSPTYNAANLVGSITNNGGADATQTGFAWGTVSTLSGGDTATTTLGSFVGTGPFNGGIGGLSASTIYYFRAYATNTGGTGYGSILNFTTGNDTPSRRMRLFEGFKIKLISGKMILHQR